MSPTPRSRAGARARFQPFDKDPCRLASHLNSYLLPAYNRKPGSSLLSRIEGRRNALEVLLVYAHGRSWEGAGLHHGANDRLIEGRVPRATNDPYISSGPIWRQLERDLRNKRRVYIIPTPRLFDSSEEEITISEEFGGANLSSYHTRPTNARGSKALTTSVC